MIIYVFNRKIHFDCDYSEAIIKKSRCTESTIYGNQGVCSAACGHDTCFNNLHRLVLCIYYNAQKNAH